jgi:DNA-binding NarL/FixJ family response regulator
MTRSRDVVLVRKLCGLGLPPQALAQSLLPVLRTLIPSHSGGVFWVDEKGEIVNLFAERLLPPEEMADYYERHHRAAAEGFAIAFRRRSESSDPVSTRSFSRVEQESAYFREVMGVLDAYHVLYGVLRDDVRPFAQLSLYRGRSDAPFNKHDADTLRSLLRYIAAGLAQEGANRSGSPASLTVNEHLGIVQMDGRVVSAPAEWHKALRLAALPQLSPRNARHEGAAVREFVDAIRARFDRTDALRTTIAHQNAWGRFTIRAFRLPDADGRRADQLGILIRREEPRMLSLLRGLGQTPLSPQQREVALLLAEGASNRDISNAMNLTMNTASYHVKQVYLRLNVHDRDKVAPRLFELANGHGRDDQGT